MLKHLCQRIASQAKRGWLQLKSIFKAFKPGSRPEEAARNEQEAERLDRLRNPSKYLGK